MAALRVSTTRRIAAPASELFQIVSSPAGHVAIDGSGMLVDAADRQMTAVGETFDMDMDRRPLGDIPEMGRYDVTNTVTQIVPDRLFEWAVGRVGAPPVGHVFGWQLEPVSDTETDVTNYCDWSGLPEDVRAHRAFPVIPLHMLEQSVANLERLVTKGGVPE